MFVFIQCEAKTTLELLYVLTSSIADYSLVFRRTLV